jgi:RNA polymerase sigma-70 factor (ECF subfamily)
MSPAHLSDEELATRFVAGDMQAFEALIQRYAKPIYNFALNFLGGADDADEAAQRVFVQMYQVLPRTRLDMPLKPWIYQIARRKCIDLWRSRYAASLSIADEEDSAPNVVEPIDTTPLPDELAERADLQRALRKAINALPPNQRMAAALRYVNQLSFAEIAKAMGVPENTAKTHFQRAKKTLRRKLAAWR